MSLFDLVIGRPIATTEERAEHIGPVAGIPVFGLDALSSAAYGPEAALVDHLSISVEGAVMAPNISKVDTDRPLNPGQSAWNFRDEVLRRVFHENSLSPFRETCSSHFTGRTECPSLSQFSRGTWGASRCVLLGLGLKPPSGCEIFGQSVLKPANKTVAANNKVSPT
jgi:hypothetical protein